MNVAEFLASKYLTADDVAGKPVVSSITEAGTELVKGDTGQHEKRLMIRLAGIAKPVLVNKTSIKILAHAYGPEVDEWVGKPVEVSAKISVIFGTARSVLSIQPV